MIDMIDDICRVVASPLSRRRAARLIAGALAGSAVMLWPRRAAAAELCRQTKLDCHNDEFICAFDATLNCCCPTGSKGCFRKNNPFASECCGMGEECCGSEDNLSTGICCTIGKCCLNLVKIFGTCCLPTETCCVNGEGRVTGTCCDLNPLPDGTKRTCCPTSGHTAACCGPGVDCCQPSLEGARNGTCCDTRPMANGESRDCCIGTLKAECCDPGFTCCPNVIGKEGGACCDERPAFGGGMCCPGTPDSVCCAKGEVCCQVNGRSLGVCCDPAQGEHCCPDANGITAKCCTFPEFCVNNQCMPLTGFAGGQGGAYTTNGQKNILRLSFFGEGGSLGPGSFVATTDIHASLSAYNFATRTRIDLIAFTMLQGTVGPGTDVSLSGEGGAIVNGVAKDITYDGTMVSGASSFEIRDANTDALLAGGYGEAGRSTLSLTIM